MKPTYSQTHTHTHLPNLDTCACPLAYRKLETGGELFGRHGGSKRPLRVQSRSMALGERLRARVLLLGVDASESDRVGEIGAGWGWLGSKNQTEDVPIEEPKDARSHICLGPPTRMFNVKTIARG